MPHRYIVYKSNKTIQYKSLLCLPSKFCILITTSCEEALAVEIQQQNKVNGSEEPEIEFGRLTTTQLTSF